MKNSQIKIEHCSYRFRYLFTNNPSWKRKLLSSNGLDVIYKYTQHWNKAFYLNPERYKEIHNVSK